MIFARSVLYIPSFTTIRNRGIATARGTNISASVFILLNVSLPLNSSLDNPKAVIELISNVNRITIVVVSKLLNTYLDAGIPDSAEKLSNKRKFSIVGCFTKKVGGYANSSVNGLKALFTINTIGRIIKTEYTANVKWKPN
jgi:hypothetical protein